MENKWEAPFPSLRIYACLYVNVTPHDSLCHAFFSLKIVISGLLKFNLYWYLSLDFVKPFKLSQNVQASRLDAKMQTKNYTTVLANPILSSNSLFFPLSFCWCLRPLSICLCLCFCLKLHVLWHICMKI